MNVPIFDGQTTDVFAWQMQALADDSLLYIVHQGGTSSGKTYACMQAALVTCLYDPGCLITVTSCSLPAIKRGARRDMMTILSRHRAEGALFSWREGQTRLVCQNGSEIEFVTFEDEQKAAAGKRDYLIVDEANTISYLLFEILAIRTTKKTTIMYNPVSPFWAHTKIIPQKTAKTIISGYRNNRFAAPNLVAKLDLAEIENPNYFRVYGRGLTGTVEGIVYSVQYANFPSDCEIIGVGLDWGFATSPTAACIVGRIDDALYLKEILYEYRQLPRDTAKELEAYKDLDIVSDSAAAAANAELSEAGYNIYPAKKPRVEDRVRFLQNFKLYIDPGSKNFVSESVGYVWNNQGAAPIKDYDHLWDAAGYLVWRQLRGGAWAL